MLQQYYIRVKEWLYGSSPVSFLNSYETSLFLLQDQDGYVTNMTSSDLTARHVSSTEEYLQKASGSAMDFTKEQKETIEGDVLQASIFLKELETPWIEKELLRRISWNIALTDGGYEEGLPHTRGKIIFLSPSYFRMSQEKRVGTMVHEWIHVYQRQFREQFQSALLAHGYKQWRVRKGYPRIRSNPDVDEFIYIHHTGKVMVSVYRNHTPTSITDIIQPNELLEHPNEEIAYLISQGVWPKNGVFLFQCER